MPPTAILSAAGAACLANVVISVCSTCLYYRLLWALGDSPAFGVQLCTLMQAIVCGGILLLCRCSSSSSAPSKGESGPGLLRWLELALWLSLQNTLEIASVDGLGPANGNLTPVLQQAGIPITLLLSRVLLARRYLWLHWLAAAFVMGGIAASYVPLLLSDATASNTTTTASDGQTAAASSSSPPGSWGYALLFLLSRVPQSIANVRCEAILLPAAAAAQHTAATSASVNSEGDLLPHRDAAAEAPLPMSSMPPPPPRCDDPRRWHSVRALLACGFWTALLGLGFNFVSSVMLACARGLGASSVLRDYSAGAVCLLSGRTANANNASSSFPSFSISSPDVYADDPCRAAAGATAAFALPGVLFAISEFQVLQLASAASYFLLIALELPLQASALAAPFVMGSLASSYHPSLFYGVPLIVLGLLVWASAERTQHRRQQRALAAAAAVAAERPDDAGERRHEREADLIKVAVGRLFQQIDADHSSTREPETERHDVALLR